MTDTERAVTRGPSRLNGITVSYKLTRHDAPYDTDPALTFPSAADAWHQAARLTAHQAAHLTGPDATDPIDSLAAIRVLLERARPGTAAGWRVDEHAATLITPEGAGMTLPAAFEHGLLLRSTDGESLLGTFGSVACALVDDLLSDGRPITICAYLSELYSRTIVIGLVRSRHGMHLHFADGEVLDLADASMIAATV